MSDDNKWASLELHLTEELLREGGPLDTYTQQCVQHLPQRPFNGVMFVGFDSREYEDLFYYEKVTQWMAQGGAVVLPTMELSKDSIRVRMGKLLGDRPSKSPPATLPPPKIKKIPISMRKNNPYYNPRGK